MMSRRSIGALLLAASLTSARIAGAAPPHDPAQVLFDRGVADMEAGLFEKACPAIEASQRLEPMPGTLFALADCEAQRGRLATAMRYYAEYLVLYRAFSQPKKAEQKDRAITSEEQLRKLDSLVPRLTLKLPATAPPDIIVERDGDIVADLSLGTALPVDPGDHIVTTRVPGAAAIETRVSLAAGESKTLELRITLDSKAPEKAPDVGPVARTAPALPPAPPDIRAWRIGTWSAGAAAVVGLTIGAVAGVLAIEQRAVMSRNCQPDGSVTRCNTAGIEAKNRLVSFGDASTVGFVAGGAGLGVGLGLYLATPTTPTPVDGVGSAPATGAVLPPFGITLNGEF